MDTSPGSIASRSEMSLARRWNGAFGDAVGADTVLQRDLICRKHSIARKMLKMKIAAARIML